ncbi:hypothetical protein NIE79_004761 [Micromonospora sp. NIE79]|uniref:Uncharacterized protein n=1 Tax=Micromonospora trifolii TaxID=2911208 RepID=A0ABS9N8B6_9ACTN|nr:hypothetical protein [Micromonospora trifolii]MCG5446193.1 hypothetical protein [Micromonospora trifolii]
MRTHAAASPGEHYGVDPLDPRWRARYPSAAPPADHPEPAVAVPPPGYGAAPVPTGYQRPPDAAVPPIPPPGPAGYDQRSADGDVPADLRWADLRLQVVYRSKRLNTGHLIEADQAFGGRGAVGPHALMLFFASPASNEPHGYRLHTAHRTWPQSPDSDVLPQLLAEMAEVAGDNIASIGRGWSPLGPEGSMVNGGDMTLSPGAWYVGVGVSTLDSDQGRWYQVARTLRDAAAAGRYMSAFNLKGQCYVLLTDGTALHIDRDPQARLGDDGVRCNKTLNPDRITYYNPYEHLTEQGDDETRDIWRQLDALHHTLTAHLLAGRWA